MGNFSSWLRPRIRLWAIFNELGYIPWRKPRAARKESGGVYMGTREAIIPFLNDDSKRTFSNLFLRPGYMIRDYVLRGQHERYLAPFTALLVFYSVFTLLIAVVKPGSEKATGILERLNEASIQIDSTENGQKGYKLVESIFQTLNQVVVLTHLDLFPEAADTPWKESLAAVEGDLRSKGIPLFLGNFLLLWFAMSKLLKKYGISVSGAAASAAYVLCQFCIFMFLALLLSFGRKSELGIIIMGILLFIDYRQLLGVDIKQALKLTIKTGLIYLLVCVLFYTLAGIALFTFAAYRI